MIPDFKTFIKESLWSDIQDRSSGNIVRKEDDIDLLDIHSLCDYMHNHYKCYIEDDIRVSNFDDEDWLVVCLYEDEVGYHKYLYYNGSSVNTQLDVLKTIDCLVEIKQNYSVRTFENDFGVKCVNIYPKDMARVNVTNKFFIEILDFILNRIDAPLEQQIKKISSVKESIWSDIQDRSSGDVVREEDVFKDIYEYVNSNYQIGFVAEDNSIFYKNDYVYVPIYKLLDFGAYCSIEIHKNDITFSSINVDKYKSQAYRKFIAPIKDDLNKFYDSFKDSYSPEISTFDGIDHWIEFKIVPDDGKVTKELCREVIDFILNTLTDNNKKIVKILEKK